MRLKLLGKGSRFSSFFWTQFLGAFNDNFFKNALVVLVAYRGVTLFGLDDSSLVALAGGVFILPFILFSPLAGQLSDRYEKSRIVRLTKIWEIVIMAVAGLGFLTQNYGLLLAVLFFMGTQSTFFGPVKYSAIPELVKEEELTEANAHIEMGTFIAILLGTILGGLSAVLRDVEYYIGGALVAVAAAGYWTSRGVPATSAGAPSLKIQLNPLPQFFALYRICSEKKTIWNSLLGISWFWFFGAGILSVLPIYCKDYLGVSPAVTTAFLAMFTIGIAVGSMLAERLSFRRVEIGLVPIGSLGMTIFLANLFFVRAPWMPVANPLGFADFIGYAEGWRLLIDFFLMSVSGGLFIVPLYTLLQERSHIDSRSRVIAGNNILNSIFMVIASGIVMLFYMLELNTAQVFLVFAVLNVIAAVYIYSIVPEFTLRFYSWIISHVMYRVKTTGLEKIPREGPVLIAGNHVTFVDWLIIMGACKRPARFVIYYKFFDVPLVKNIMRQAKVIPIAGPKEDLEILKNAFGQIAAELQKGQVVAIFPEGSLTRTGTLSPFQSGIVRALRENPVPVVPVTLKGFWGSIFSHGRKSWLPESFRRPVEVRFHDPISPGEFSLRKLENLIAGELGEPPPSSRGASAP